MEVTTLTSTKNTMEFKIGYLQTPPNWEVSVFVDNIGATPLSLQKNFNPNPAGAPLWKNTDAGDVISDNGTTIFRLVGGGHFRLLPLGTPVDVFVAVSY